MRADLPQMLVLHGLIRVLGVQPDLWIELADSVPLAQFILTVSDVLSVVQPEDLRPAGLAETVSLAPMPVTDSVTIILT